MVHPEQISLADRRPPVEAWQAGGGFRRALASRWSSLGSLILFSSAVLGYLWFGKFLYHHQLILAGVYLAAVVIVVVNHVVHGDTPEKTGFRLDNLKAAAAWFGLLTLAGAVMVTGAGFIWGDVRLDRGSDIYVYVGWAFLQQYVLQNFLRLRSEDVLLRRGLLPSLLAALLFSAFHWPNIPLTVLTFLAGLLWCWFYTRTPNFICSWASHTILAVLLMLFFKHDVLGQFGVGRPGYRFDFYGAGVKVAAGYDSSGRPFIATLPGPDKGHIALVKIFTPTGHLLNQWEAFPNLDFSGEIAVGDLGFGPGDEIAVAPGPGRRNPGIVKLFTPEGQLLDSIQAPLPELGYGAWVSISCRRLYIAPGPAPLSPQMIVEYSPATGTTRTWEFPELGFANSIRAVSLCDSPDDFPTSLILWASPIAVNPSTVVFYNLDDKSLRPSQPIQTTFGANVALVRFEEGDPGFVVAPGPLMGYPPMVAVVDLNGRVRREFVAFNDRFACGSNIAAVNVDGQPGDELVLGEGIGPGRPPLVRIVDLDGRILNSFSAYTSAD